MIEGILFAIGSVAALIVCVINQRKKPHHPLLPDPDESPKSRSFSSDAELVAELRRKIAGYEEHRKKLREFGRSRMETYHDNIDAVLLGPMSSGKTSLATLWASPLSHNNTPSATIEWQRFNLNLHEFEVEKKFDSLFDVERNFKRVLRLRLRDYPGEIGKFPEAIQMIDDLSSKTTIIFMLQVGYSKGVITGVSDNAEYFNRVFVEQIHRGLKEVLESVAKVFVVFNKVDLLPPEWDESEAVKRVVSANNDPLSFIKRVFGTLVEIHLVSVKNNLGVVNLLGDIGQVAIDVVDERDRFRKRIGNLGRQYAKRAL